MHTSPAETYVPQLQRGRPKMHWLERAYIYFTLAAVTLTWPWIWFSRTSPLDVTNVDTRGSVLYFCLFAVAGVLLLANWQSVRMIFRNEPALPMLIALAIISFLWSGQPDIALRRSFALALSGIFGMYLAVRVPLPVLLRMVAWVLLARVLVDYAMIFGLPSFGLETNGSWQGRASGKNNLGRESVMAVLLMVWQILSARRARFAFLIGAVLAVGLVIGSRSSTALVMLLLLIAALPAYQALRARKTLFGAVLISLLGGSALASAVALSQLEVLTGLLGKDVTLTGRTTLWAESIAAIAERPVFGAGYASFWTGWFGPNHDIWLALGTFRTPHAHNGLIDVTLDLGIIGGILYATVFWRAIVRAVKFCRTYLGAAGLFPLAYIALSVLASSTEHGVLRRNSLLWVLFVSTVCYLSSVADGSPADRNESGAPGPGTGDAGPSQRLELETV